MRAVTTSTPAQLKKLIGTQHQKLMKPPFQELEVVTLTRTLERGGWAPHEVAEIHRAIGERKARVLCGLLDATASIWTRKLQEEVEPQLRMRNDPVDGFVIDRWTGEMWHQIPGKIGKQHIKPGLCERMKYQYDMQRISSPKHDADAISGAARHPVLQQRDTASGAVIRTNDRASTDKVLAAVDSLSRKSVEQFVAVERARHTGEKIVHHGADLRFVEHVEQLEKQGNPAPPSDDEAMNPGLNPKAYKRESGGEHINE